MPRQRKGFERKVDFRDASLIIIASEGFATEPHYFEELNTWLRSRRIKIVPLRREHIGQSSPHHVIQCMDSWKKKNKVQPEDRLFIIVDRDRWDLTEAAKLCIEKKYEFIVSNPCFEIWLLMHFENFIEVPSNEMNDIRLLSADDLKQRMKKHIPGYTASNFDFALLAPGIIHAIAVARQLDTDPNSRWPNQLGSRVYKPVEAALALKGND